MEIALRTTRTAPEEIDYVNAHATSTPIGDASEVKALKAVFTTPAARPAISSTKALTGHGLSLAGAMESGFCALAVRDGFMPGSAHIANLDPVCEGLNIIRSTLPAQPRVAMNNVSGFGGANVSLIFRQAR
jgi:3-oxoacyl-[acyl-carrier-protein] synthase-1